VTSPAHTDTVVDPTVYPVEERVGEDILQRWIVELLRPLVERWLASRGEIAFVGADQFIYYERFDSTARVAPDVYVLPGIEPDRHVPIWKIWETSVSPSFALEVVSRNRRKDYEEAPERHAAAGTQELVVFDPWPTRRPRGLGIRWQVFRRRAGKLMRVEATDADRIDSEQLGCWLRVVGEDTKQRVRLALGPAGDVLVQTTDEALEAEVAAKEAALRRIAELEALLESKKR
jgi:hypothetical protein